MLVLETVLRIRREHASGKAIKAIARDLHLSRKVVLMGNSRGGNAILNYVYNGGGATTLSHAILGGIPNHGVWAPPGIREGSEFSGTGPFLTALNAPQKCSWRRSERPSSMDDHSLG